VAPGANALRDRERSHASRAGELDRQFLRHEFFAVGMRVRTRAGGTCMHVFCTYFDRNYLVRGLALYRSLVRTTRDFTLWTLALDDECYAILQALRPDRMRLVRLRDVEQFDPEAATTRSTRSLVEYFWTLTPVLPLYVLDRAPEAQVVTYLDADLFFYSGADHVLRELGDRSLLVHCHDFAPAYRGFESVGLFNVGSLPFRRDGTGLGCLQRWRSQCIEWCFHRVEPNRWGNQKYIDEWPALYGERLRISRNRGIGLGPWNESNFRVQPAPATGVAPLVDGSPAVFFHFHDLKLASPRCAWIGYYDVSTDGKRAFYVPYLQALESAWRSVREVAPGFSAGASTLTLRAGLDAFRQRRLFLRVAGRTLIV
jgi:hypothetical protein